MFEIKERPAIGGPCSSCQAWRDFDPWKSCSLCGKATCDACAKSFRRTFDFSADQPLPTSNYETSNYKVVAHACPLCVRRERGLTSFMGPNAEAFSELLRVQMFQKAYHRYRARGEKRFALGCVAFDRAIKAVEALANKEDRPVQTDCLGRPTVWGCPAELDSVLRPDEILYEDDPRAKEISAPKPASWLDDPLPVLTRRVIDYERDNRGQSPRAFKMGAVAYAKVYRALSDTYGVFGVLRVRNAPVVRDDSLPVEQVVLDGHMPTPRATCTVDVKYDNYNDPTNKYLRPCGAPAVESGPHGAWCQEHWDVEDRKTCNGCGLLRTECDANPRACGGCDCPAVYVTMSSISDKQVAFHESINAAILNSAPVPVPDELTRELNELHDHASALKAGCENLIGDIQRERRVLAKVIGPKPEPASVAAPGNYMTLDAAEPSGVVFATGWMTDKSPCDCGHARCHHYGISSTWCLSYLCECRHFRTPLPSRLSRAWAWLNQEVRPFYGHLVYSALAGEMVGLCAAVWWMVYEAAGMA